MKYNALFNPAPHFLLLVNVTLPWHLHFAHSNVTMVQEFLPMSWASDDETADEDIEAMAKTATGTSIGTT